MRLLALVVVSLSLGCTYDFDGYLPRGQAADSGATTDTAGGDTASGCAEPGAKSFGGHCYFPTSAALAWDAAKTACESTGGHLATVASSAEETAVESVGSGDRWIGLTRPTGSPVKADSFKWVTGETMSYLKWGPGQPTGAGECGAVRNGGSWSDIACATALVAICER
jgi:hypothetical protein